MLKLFISIAAFYIIITAVVYFKQRSMLYFPSNRGLHSEHAKALSIEKWPEDTEYRGYLSDPPGAERTIVVFHGNAGEAADRSYYLSALAAFNARVILAEYPGYGGRPGTPSETIFVSDAKKTLSLAATEFPEEPLIVIGESMGSGVASAAVAMSTSGITANIPAIQGLVLITPWDSLAELAQTHYWYLPARWLVRDRYDNVRNLQSFKAPKAIVTAGLDKIIPVKHGNTLFASIPSIKAQFMLDSAGHNDWLNYVDDQWWQELKTFVTTGVAASSDNQPSIQTDD